MYDNPCVIVIPVQNKELTPNILEKLFHEACQALSEPSLSRDTSSFKVEYVGNPKDAEKILQRTISEFRNQFHGPVIAVIECPDVDLMKTGIRALDDFPCVSVPSNVRDSQHQIIGWQVPAAKIGLQRCAASSRWLNERISLSRYSHVPVGNFEQDWIIHIADIFFARALRDQQQILWVSDNGILDLGGDYEEETCYSDEVNQPVYIHPGAYRKVTVELKIHNLAVNALLKSNQVNEMEGGTLFGYDHDLAYGAHLPNEQLGLDEATSCSLAFRVLKQLIQRCLADAVSSGNIYADAMLQHLYRWLCRDLFEWIELEPMQFWHSLLFMDQLNYGGIKTKSDETDDDPQVDIVSSWNITYNLPAEIQDHFLLIVSQFMYRPWKFAVDQVRKRAKIRDDDSCTLSITAAAAKIFESSMIEYLSEQDLLIWLMM